MRERTRAIAVLVAVLALGCLIGAAGTWIRYGRRAAGSTPASLGAPQPPPPRVRLPELLDMSSEQESRFEAIMAESRQRLDALRLEQRSKIDAVIDETNKKIHGILDDAQKAKLDAFLVDVEKRRGGEGRGEGRGAGPHGERGFGPPPPPWQQRGGRDPEQRRDPGQ